jgi:hypothetical protein
MAGVFWITGAIVAGGTRLAFGLSRAGPDPAGYRR